MTLIFSLIAVIAPSIVTALTGFFKNLPAYTSLSDSSRTPAVRFLAAVLSFFAVILSEWVAGSFQTNIILVAVQTVLLTAVTWFASLGIWHSTKPSPTATT